MWDGFSSSWFLDGLFIAIAGAAGALVRTMSDPMKNWKKLLVDVPTGAILAIYLGDMGTAFITPISGVLKMSAESQAKAGAFLIGVLGMLVIEAIVTFWQNKATSIKGKDDK